MFSALRHKNFRLFVAGQFISLVGFWMQSVGQSWLIYRLTHSAFYLGAIAFSQQIPILLLAFAAGGLVDRTNRHRVVMITQSLALVQASLLALLTFSGYISIPYLFMLAALLGIISALDLPARQAFLIQMVGKEDLMNAIAINSSLFNAARMIGPAIAGFTVARWGEATCFLINAISYVPVIASLLLMRLPRKEGAVRKQALWKDVHEGFRFVRRTNPVGVLLKLTGAFGLTGFAFVILLPLFADEIFRRGATGLGWLTTATGLGALSGALFLAGRKGLHGIGKLISFSTFAYSASLMLFSFSPTFWLAFVLLIFVGLFMMITVASTNTAIQSMIPDELRGRVMSFFTSMLIGTAPVGSLIAGAIAKYIGAQMTVFFLALSCLITSVWYYRLLPTIGAEARRLFLLQNPPLAGEPVPAIAVDPEE